MRLIGSGSARADMFREPESIADKQARAALERLAECVIIVTKESCADGGVKLTASCGKGPAVAWRQGQDLPKSLNDVASHAAVEQLRDPARLAACAAYIKADSGLCILLCGASGSLEVNKAPDENILWEGFSIQAVLSRMVLPTGLVGDPGVNSDANETATTAAGEPRVGGMALRACGRAVEPLQWTRILFRCTQVDKELPTGESVRILIGFRLDRGSARQSEVPSELYIYRSRALVLHKPLAPHLSLPPAGGLYTAGYTMVAVVGGMAGGDAGGSATELSPQISRSLNKILRELALKALQPIVNSTKFSSFVERLETMDAVPDDKPAPRRLYALSEKRVFPIHKTEAPKVDVVTFRRGRVARRVKVEKTDEKKSAGGGKPTAAAAVAPNAAKKEPAKAKTATRKSTRSRKRKAPERFTIGAGSSSDEADPEETDSDDGGRRGSSSKRRRTKPGRGRHPKMAVMRRELTDIANTIEAECFREYWREWESVGRPDDSVWDDSPARGRVIKETQNWLARLNESRSVADFTQRLLELEASMLPAYHTELWRGKKAAVRQWELGRVPGRTRERWLASGRNVQKFDQWIEFKQEFDFYSCREAGQLVDARRWLARHSCEDSGTDSDGEDSAAKMPAVRTAADCKYRMIKSSRALYGKRSAPMTGARPPAGKRVKSRAMAIRTAASPPPTVSVAQALPTTPNIPFAVSVGPSSNPSASRNVENAHVQAAMKDLAQNAPSLQPANAFWRCAECGTYNRNELRKCGKCTALRGPVQSYLLPDNRKTVNTMDGKAIKIGCRICGRTDHINSTKRQCPLHPEYVAKQVQPTTQLVILPRATPVASSLRPGPLRPGPLPAGPMPAGPMPVGPVLAGPSPAGPMLANLSPPGRLPPGPPAEPEEPQTPPPGYESSDDERARSPPPPFEESNEPTDVGARNCSPPPPFTESNGPTTDVDAGDLSPPPPYEDD